MDSAERKLERLLAEKLPRAARRAREAFDLAAMPWQDALVLFGAGGQGRGVLRLLRSQGVEPLAFADSNPELWHREVEGLAVLSPAEAARRYGARCAFVVTVWNPEADYAGLMAHLRSLGCERIVPLPLLMWKYAKVMLPSLFFDTPEAILAQAEAIRRAFHLFREPESQSLFADQVELYLSGNPGCVESVESGEEYFPADLFALREDEVFIDVGAFDGDVLQAYVGRCNGRYIGLEPDPASFRKLQECVSALSAPARERVVLHQVAASDRQGEVGFDATGSTGARVTSEGTARVQAVPLDDLLAKESLTYLKLDVEGHEYEALLGVQQTILRHRPVLAVSVYHRPADLWRIPNLIRGWVPEYSVFLRRYARCGFELDLYALPPERLAGPDTTAGGSH